MGNVANGNVSLHIDLVHAMDYHERITRLVSGHCRFTCTNMYLPPEIQILCQQYIADMDIKSNTEIEIESKQRERKQRERVDPRKMQIALMGASGVGKTSITERIVHGIFPIEYRPCIEDWYFKNMVVDGVPIRIELIDTAGQEEFVTILHEYLRHFDCLLWVYSISSRESFDHIQTLPELQQDACDLDADEWKNVKYGVLCGNKCDLDDINRVVSKKEGQQLAESWGSNITFWETSAKEDINLNEALKQCVKMYRKRLLGQCDVQVENVHSDCHELCAVL
eukprot:202186_1